MCLHTCFRLPSFVDRRITGMLLLLGAIYGSSGPAAVMGQQVLVDDPTSVEVNAAQLEAWHGREESYIAPAIRVLPALEVAVGTAFLRTDAADRRRVEYSGEGKLLLRPGSEHRVGAAIVGGAGVRQIGVPRGRPASLYGYGILSEDLIPGRLTAYQNVGWLNVENGPHQFTWGARLDWSPLSAVTVIGEVYGEGQTDPSLQGSLRTVLVPGQVEADVSITRAGPFDERRTWLTVGFTFMSSHLY